MIQESPLTRVGTVDFFGIVVPGSYIIMVSLLAFLAVTGSGGESFVSGIEAIVAQVRQWPVAIILLLAIYLVGSLPRAFAVGATEKVCLRYRRLLKGPWAKRSSETKLCSQRMGRTWAIHDDAPFPYPEMLRKLRIELAKRGLADDEDANESKELSVVDFDYWKITIQKEWPASIPFVRSLESRVRYFVGMFWASITGVIAATVALCASVIRSATSGATGFGSLALLMGGVVAFGLAFAGGFTFRRPSLPSPVAKLRLCLILLGGVLEILFAALTWVDDPWFAPATLALVFSAAIGTLYAWRLQFTRVEEVYRVYLMYAVLSRLGRSDAKLGTPGSSRCNDSGPED